MISQVKILIILVAIHFSSIFADELPKKHNLSICTIFKNEARFLREWIEYHRLIGVDHFYLYNNGSKDAYMKMLKPYIRDGIVTLIHWPDFIKNQTEENAFIWSLSTQVTAYENAIKVRAEKETKWLIFVDVDEFLVLPRDGTLLELIARHEDKPGIIIGTDYFDASKVDTLPVRNLLIETIELTRPPRINPQKEVTKTIFKPDLCEGFIWPPYKCKFKDEQTAVALSKRELHINHYVDRFAGSLRPGKRKDKLHVDNRMLSDEETAQLLSEGYEIEDQYRTIQRFVPKLSRRLGIEKVNLQQNMWDD